MCSSDLEEEEEELPEEKAKKEDEEEEAKKEDEEEAKKEDEELPEKEDLEVKILALEEEKKAEEAYKNEVRSIVEDIKERNKKLLSIVESDRKSVV